MTTVATVLGLQGAELVSRGEDGRGKAELLPATELLAGKTVGLYFSAHWCPPCRGFTPQLARLYERLRQQGQQFEVVFVSADRSEDQFREYFGHMPWLAVPWKDAALRSRLSDMFSVAGIPRLVILGPDGAVLANDAKAAVSADPSGERFPWAGAAAPTGLLGLLSSPRGMLLLFMLLYWLVQWFTKNK